MCSHQKGHSGPWATTASSPSGALFLSERHRGTSGDRSAWPPTDDGDGACGHVALFSEDFAGRIGMIREQLVYLLANAEKMAASTRIDPEQALILLAKIRRAASDLNNARRSEVGWQDIHADDLVVIDRCRMSCAPLLASLGKSMDSARSVF